MNNDQSAKLSWREGEVPVSGRFDDPYYSLEDGWAETRHVFLAGNDLPQRFRDGFHIAELGFGTGLNLFAALWAWREHGAEGRFRFTSFEAYPLPAQDMARALSRYPELSEIAEPFLKSWARGMTKIDLPDVVVEVITGDARETLPVWSGAADAWFLDGFSPAKNPALWGADIMKAVAAHSRKNATFATYTAAGHVRNALSDAGFDVTRIPGFGRKRHMSVGRIGG